VILAVPAATPVTIPLNEPTVATEVEPEDHEPPVTVLLNVMLFPVHTLPTPEMAVGAELTVITAVVIQPVPGVYVIVAVPRDNPFTMPLVIPIVATEVLLLLHVPPPVVLANVVV
jgi:hypothetical protein